MPLHFDVILQAPPVGVVSPERLLLTESGYCLTENFLDKAIGNYFSFPHLDVFPDN